MEFKRPAFAESVDVAFNLGVDPKHAEENIRLSLVLPHGVGKDVSVLAIVNSEKEAEAKSKTKSRSKQNHLCCLARE